MTLDEAIAAAKWERLDNLQEARCYQGRTERWQISVVAFDIEPQGFPKGSLGYDGAASSMSEGLVLRLTREQAERAFKKATKT
jgi:hypothetical protein